MIKISFKLKDIIRISIPVFLLIMFLILTGCTSQQKEASVAEDKVLNIACTIPPEEEFIRAIGGDRVNVTLMVPPGASPHTFEPTPSQITALESADLYIALGSGIEFENRWLSKIKKMYPDLKIINGSERIMLLPNTPHHHEEEENDHHEEEAEEEGPTDPHVWLSPKNAAVIVNATCDALSDLKPELKEEFSHNRDIYLDELGALDTSIRKSLDNIPSRTILVYHPAFGYFCRDYNLTQLSIEENGHEPTGKGIGEVISDAKAANITLVFSEPESSQQGAVTLAKEINGTVVMISPLSGDYLKNMQHIADSIARK